MSDQVADKLEEEAQVRLEVARELKEEKRKRWKLEDQVTELQKECSKVQLQLEEKKRACDKAKCEAEDERVLRHDAEYNLEAFEKELRRSKVSDSSHDPKREEWRGRGRIRTDYRQAQFIVLP